MFGVLGNPIGHSLSPAMHAELLSELGQQGCYVPFQRESEELAETVSAMRTLQFTGFNVTLPYKEAIIEYLDELTPQARFMGAVNTVHHKDDRLLGYNTDGVGFYLGLKNSGFDATAKQAMLFGAGGAARGVAVNLIENGLSKLILFNRTLEKAERLKDALLQVSSIEIVCKPLDQNVVREYLPTSHLVVNTTALGMWPAVNETPFPFDEDVSELTVYDLVYNPLQTTFLKSARAAGARVVDGLDMFIFQGVEALRIWLERDRIDFDYDKIRTFLIERLKTYVKH